MFRNRLVSAIKCPRGLNDVTILLLLALFFPSWFREKAPCSGKMAASSSSLVGRTLVPLPACQVSVSPCLWLGPLTILEPITWSRRMSALIGQAWVIDPPLEPGETKSTQIHKLGEEDPMAPRGKERWMAGTAGSFMFSKKQDNRRDRERPTPGHRLGDTRDLFRDSKI